MSRYMVCLTTMDASFPQSFLKQLDLFSGTVIAKLLMRVNDSSFHGALLFKLEHVCPAGQECMSMAYILYNLSQDTLTCR